MLWIDQYTYRSADGRVYREYENGDEYSDHDTDSYNDVIYDVLKAIEDADAAVIAKVGALLVPRPKYRRGMGVRMFKPVDIW